MTTETREKPATACPAWCTEKYEHDWESAVGFPHRYIRTHSREALAAGFDVRECCVDVSRTESRELDALESTWGPVTVTMYVNADGMPLPEAERLLSGLTAATMRARQLAETSTGGQ